MSYSLSQMIFEKLSAINTGSLMPEGGIKQPTALQGSNTLDFGAQTEVGYGAMNAPVSGTPIAASPAKDEVDYTMGNPGVTQGFSTVNPDLASAAPATAPGGTFSSSTDVNVSGSLLSGGNTDVRGQKERVADVPAQTAQLAPAIPKPDLKVASALNLLLPLLAIGGSAGYVYNKATDAEANAKKKVLTHAPATILAALAAGTLGAYGNRKIRSEVSSGSRAQTEIRKIKARQAAILARMGVRNVPMVKQSVSTAALATILGAPAIAYAAGKGIDTYADERAKEITKYMLPIGSAFGLLAGYAAPDLADLLTANKRKRDLTSLRQKAYR